MACAYQQPAYGPAPRPRIRVVLADSDAARRGLVRHALFSTAGYELIREVDTAMDLARVVNAEAPELVIGSLPLLLSSDAAGQPFPVCIAIGPAPVSSPERTIASLPEQVSAATIGQSLSAATVRILNVKASELSSLIRQYLLHSDAMPAQPFTLEVEQDGRRSEIEAEAVLWIKAAGNYVRLHTASGAFTMRSSIRSVATRLRRLGFVRIHRGTVVNRRAVRSQVLPDDGVPLVVLEDGTQLAIGPRYRDVVLTRDVLPPPQ